MLVQRLIQKNWRNFRHVDVRLRDVTDSIGANATGKSNLLDVFPLPSRRLQGTRRRPAKGGDGPRRYSQVALSACSAGPGGSDRGPFGRLGGDPEPACRYQLGFKPEGKGAQRLLVTEEKVFRRGRPDAVLLRPSLQDKSDRTRLTQTYIENVQANAEFREIAGFFSEMLYLHVVPQLLKFGDQIGGQRLDNDPFGQGLLEQVAGVPEKVRASRLGRIEHALKLAIPQFGQSKFVRDEVTSRPHLEVRYQHHRPNAGWQREDPVVGRDASAFWPVLVAIGQQCAPPIGGTRTIAELSYRWANSNHAPSIAARQQASQTGAHKHAQRCLARELRDRRQKCAETILWE